MSRVAHGHISKEPQEAQEAQEAKEEAQEAQEEQEHDLSSWAVFRLGAAGSAATLTEIVGLRPLGRELYSDNGHFRFTHF